MRHTLLGSTGLRVSSIALGTMTFGTGTGSSADEATSRRMFDHYADHGGNFIDTANVYTGGTSEGLVGRFSKGRRERLVIASKYTVATDPADPNGGGNGRKTLVQALDASLKRLGTDYLDLYWVHGYDGLTPVEETARALDDAVRAGKVLYVGLSNHPAWQVSRADMLAACAGWTRPAAIQVEYNLAQRDAERDLLPMADLLGMGVVAWAPLAGGVLTGKYLGGSNEGRIGKDVSGHYAKYRDARDGRVARVVTDCAGEVGCSPSQLALAWLLQRSPRLIPLVGGRKVEQLADTLGALEVSIPPEVKAKLDEAGAIELGYPHDFLRDGREHWFGDTDSWLDRRVPIHVTGVR